LAILAADISGILSVALAKITFGNVIYALILFAGLTSTDKSIFEKNASFINFSKDIFVKFLLWHV